MTMSRLRKPSPALILALVALIAACAGSAYAAQKIGTKQLKNGAVSTKKLKNGAVTAAKLGGGAVTADKVANGAIGLAGLSAEARSTAFVKTAPAQVSLPVALDPTRVGLLSLPVGSQYVVTAQVSLGGNGASPTNAVTCTLRDNGALISAGSGYAPVGLFTDTVTVTGVTDGGSITYDCDPNASSQARNVVIAAIRVDSVQGS